MAVFKNALGFVFAVLILCGCATKHQSPKIANFSSQAFEISTQKGSNLLYVSHENEDFYFTMVNAMGTPLARRILKPNGKFENIGFLPPNSAYNELFVKVLEAIKANKKETEILIRNEKFKVKVLDIRQ